MKVPCEIIEVEIENEDGIDVDGVQAICQRCGHTTESFGTGEASIKRCLALMREGCPDRERNYYVDAEEE